MPQFQTNLSEFMSDYFQMEGARNDSDKDIARAYLEQEPSMDNVSDEEFDTIATNVAVDVRYYRS